MAISIKGDPYDFPYDGNLRPEKTAFVIVDMQVDYLQPGGYFDAMGYDIAPMRAAIEPTRRALAAAREAGLHVIFVREGYRADLADLPEVVRWRSKRVGAEIGDQWLLRDGPRLRADPSRHLEHGVRRHHHRCVRALDAPCRS
jgi:nicotinamidase-related amidase